MKTPFVFEFVEEPEVTTLAALRARRVRWATRTNWEPMHRYDLHTGFVHRAIGCDGDFGHLELYATADWQEWHDTPGRAPCTCEAQANAASPTTVDVLRAGGVKAVCMIGWPAMARIDLTTYVDHAESGCRRLFKTRAFEARLERAIWYEWRDAPCRAACSCERAAAIANLAIDDTGYSLADLRAKGVRVAMRPAWYAEPHRRLDLHTGIWHGDGRCLTTSARSGAPLEEVVCVGWLPWADDPMREPCACEREFILRPGNMLLRRRNALTPIDAKHHCAIAANHEYAHTVTPDLQWRPPPPLTAEQIRAANRELIDRALCEMRLFVWRPARKQAYRDALLRLAVHAEPGADEPLRLTVDDIEWLRLEVRRAH